MWVAEALVLQQFQKPGQKNYLGSEKGENQEYKNKICTPRVSPFHLCNLFCLYEQPPITRKIKQTNK